MRLDPEFASGGHLIALQEGHGTQDSHPGSTSPNPRDREKGYFTKEIGGNVNDSMLHPHSLECIRELVGKVHKRSSWWQKCIRGRVGGKRGTM